MTFHWLRNKWNGASYAGLQVNLSETLQLEYYKSSVLYSSSETVKEPKSTYAPQILHMIRCITKQLSGWCKCSKYCILFSKPAQGVLKNANKPDMMWSFLLQSTHRCHFTSHGRFWVCESRQINRLHLHSEIQETIVLSYALTTLAFTECRPGRKEVESEILLLMRMIMTPTCRLVKAEKLRIF